MSVKHSSEDLPFGAVQGIASGNVPAYCCDYDTVDETRLTNREAFRHYENGIYTGYKWQCVEFARRWLLINTGCVFDDVAMAYDIFNLESLKRVQDGKRLPLMSYKNGSPIEPEVGGMLIWQEGGEFAVTGHVAIIVGVEKNRLYIAEQNASFSAWPAGMDYSRSLPIHKDEQGNVWVEEEEHGTPVLGWMLQKNDTSYSQPTAPFTPSKLKILSQTASSQPSQSDWLDVNDNAENAYVHMMDGHRMKCSGDQSQFYIMSTSAQRAVRRATAELHSQFLFAVDHVLKRPETWSAFNIPEAVWPKIQQSWNNRRNEVMTGRFDFCLTEMGLKCYEYNADSASCYMEAGRIQGKWAEAFNVKLGVDSGGELFEGLVKAWKRIRDEVTEHDQSPLHIHILYDNDLEEAYHAKFMAQAMEKAGIITHMQLGFKGIKRNSDGGLSDKNGVAIRRVWKTWAWETALDQLRSELANESKQNTSSLRLVDVLLHDNIMVHEPLWTLLPSNKAILPILWELFPDSPYLLESTMQLTDSLKQQGYVSKPIAGRCGSNISIVDAQANEIAGTSGQFADQNQIYQAFFPLPLIGNQYVQICSFCVHGSMHGLCTRIDPKPVVTSSSDVAPLRIVSDDEHGEFLVSSINN
ncbi:bifunctional glutathionylspermidine amidase/synthase [Alteromonas sp. D210916BOD_24]|uniref:glutathionylspermidine synthase family protein n=1 Tax=Alteromonas sp. D210916BOD_24 TaxID=3157618 RepID=UPI00399C6820